jgi:hypothetical protein
MEQAPRPDPIRFEVIRNALTVAMEEMALALRRSAYSTNIKTRADYLDGHLADLAHRRGGHGGHGNPIGVRIAAATTMPAIDSSAAATKATP